MKTDTPILLAEDNEDDILAMRLAFREAGLRNPLLVARNGQEAIWYLVNGEGAGADPGVPEPPGLLLLDLKMPLMDGFDVLRCLKRRRPKGLVVVVLTASKRETDLVGAFDLGADAYLVKPGAFIQLVEMVRGLRQRLEERPNASPGLALARRWEERL